IKSINATYVVQHSFSNHSKPIKYKVDAKFNTTIASIHLDSQKTTKVQCDFVHGIVTATFCSSADISKVTKQAYGNKILILIDGKWGCNNGTPGKATWVYATSLDIIDGKTLKFSNASITKAKNYVESYYFVLAPVTPAVSAREFGGIDLKFTIPATTSPALTLTPGLTVECSDCGATANLNLKLEVTGSGQSPPKLAM
ncbi:hypothetical protein HK096_001738, partial [Nowakowskiella sp. JEL0078]